MTKRGSWAGRSKKKIASSVLARKWTSYSKNKQNPTPQRKLKGVAPPTAAPSPLLHQAQMSPPEGFTGQPMSFLLVTAFCSSRSCTLLFTLPWSPKQIP